MPEAQHFISMMIATDRTAHTEHFVVDAEMWRIVHLHLCNFKQLHVEQVGVHE